MVGPQRRPGRYAEAGDVRRLHLELHLSAFDEAEWNERLMDRAVEGLRADPGYLLTNAWENVGRFLELDPTENEGAEAAGGRALGFRDLTLPLFSVVTVAGTVGLWRFRSDRRVRWLAVLALQFAVLCILILAPPRLRAPFDLAACIGTGLLVASVLDRRSATGAGGATRRSGGDGIRTHGPSMRPKRFPCGGEPLTCGDDCKGKSWEAVRATPVPLGSRRVATASASRPRARPWRSRHHPGC